MRVETGIGPIGSVDWGTHFCHFYKTADDLAETLVPFFKTGLEAGEACLWVTADPFGKEQARAALNTHVQHLDHRLAQGQIAIFDHREWYERHGGASPGAVAGMWIDWTGQATANGFAGLRLTGNTAFLDRDSWDGFMDYENALRGAFDGHRLIALCSYDTGKCDSDAVLDVVQAHDFALSRRRGAWEVVEQAAVKRSKQALQRLNAELEDRIETRTRELSDALAHQRLLTAELSHRVKNTIAGVQALVDQSLRTGSMETARVAVRGRLHALARAHDQLAADDWRGVGLRQALTAVLGPYGGRILLAVNGETLNPRAALGLAMVFHELATNAAKYGALRAEGGRVVVVAERASDGVLRLTWRESGGPAVGPAVVEGFGTRLIRQIVAHDLRGECELAFDHGGLACAIRVPAAESLVAKARCAHGGCH